MSDSKIKITVPVKVKRTPVPQKPPKVEVPKNAYKRKPKHKEDYD